jgi:GT2 family glycosyltransferase
VIIPEKSVGKSFWVKVRDFERSFYVGTEVESARFFRRDLAEKVGGFDEDIVFFEESTLPQKIGRLGYNVRARISANILHHEEDFSLLRWLRKKFYYGRSIAKYKKKYGNHATKQLGISYRLSIFLRDKKFYSKTVLAIGVSILKILEYCSVELGAFAGKLKRSSN